MSDYCDIHTQVRLIQNGKDNAIEFIYVKPEQRDEIRFVFYSPVPNTMYVSESDWLELYKEAIDKNVFPGEFVEFLATLDKITKDKVINSYKGTKENRIIARGKIVNNNVMSTIDLIENENGRQLRFVYHKENENGKFKNVTRPLDLPVYEMIELFEDAVKQSVFSSEILNEMVLAAKIRLGFDDSEYDKDDCLDRTHPNKLK